MRIPILSLLFLATVFLLAPGALEAQGGMPAAQGLAGHSLRGYTPMFIAYAIAWALILGWVVSIFRRLGRVERALKR